MKYLVLLMVVLAVSACEEKKVGSSAERIEVQRFDASKAYEKENAAFEAKRSQMDKKTSSGAAETSPQK